MEFYSGKRYFIDMLWAQVLLLAAIIYIYIIDTEEGHLLIENVVNIFFVTSLSVSLHNLLDFYNLFCLCCIVMSRQSVTH
jgi:hypothetical protein